MNNEITDQERGFGAGRLLPTRLRSLAFKLFGDTVEGRSDEELADWIRDTEPVFREGGLVRSPGTVRWETAQRNVAER